MAFDSVGFAAVRFQLGGVELDVGSLETVVVDELVDGAPAVFLVMVPISRTLRKVRTLQIVRETLNTHDVSVACLARRVARQIRYSPRCRGEG